MRRILGIGLWISACQAVPDAMPQLERHRFDHAAMGTSWSIVLYARDADRAGRAAQAAFAVVDEIDRVASDYDPQSELALLVGHEPSTESSSCSVSPLLCELLVEACAYAAQTNGAFDPTMGSLTRVWRRARRQAALPTAERITTALAAVGFEDLRVDPTLHRVSLNRAGMRLDLGGVAKGQALDRALAALRREGIDVALIEGGGDLRAGAAPPGTAGWIVALENSPLRVMLVEAGMATSGATYRGFEIDGVGYSHLIDPRSGLAMTGARSATVIATCAAEADAFASAACVVRRDEAEAWFGDRSSRAALLGGAAEGLPWASSRWAAYEIADSSADAP